MVTSIKKYAISRGLPNQREREDLPNQREREKMEKNKKKITSEFTGSGTSIGKIELSTTVCTLP